MRVRVVGRCLGCLDRDARIVASPARGPSPTSPLIGADITKRAQLAMGRVCVRHGVKDASGWRA